MMIDDDDDDEYCLTIVNIEQQYALSPLVEVIFTLRNKRNSDENLSKGKRELPLFETDINCLFCLEGSKQFRKGIIEWSPQIV